MSIVQLPSSQDTLLLVAEFPSIECGQLFEYWIRPELLRGWWPQDAHVDPQVGGVYQLIWHGEPEWTMRGHITTMRPGEDLGFSWKWDHEPPEFPPLQVDVRFEPMPNGGSQVKIQHGPYGDSSDEQEARQGLMEGWEFFLSKLQRLLTEGNGVGR